MMLSAKQRPARIHPGDGWSEPGLIPPGAAGATDQPREAANCDQLRLVALITGLVDAFEATLACERCMLSLWLLCMLIFLL